MGTLLRAATRVRRLYHSIMICLRSCIRGIPRLVATVRTCVWDLVKEKRVEESYWGSRDPNYNHVGRSNIFWNIIHVTLSTYQSFKA